MFTYEINIFRNVAGRDAHFARVQLPVGIDQPTAVKQHTEFANRFPAADGFGLTLEKITTATSQTIAYSEGA